MIIEHRGKRMYVTPLMFKNMRLIVNDVVNKVRDFWGVVAGDERIGKSYGVKQFAFLIDYFLFTDHNIDKEFDLDNIHFTTVDYLLTRKSAESADETSRTDILDESKRDLDRKKYNTSKSVDFEDYMSECGSEYGFHFILLPLWSDINSYTLLKRATLIIQFESIRNNEFKIEKGKYKVFPIPYSNNVLVNGKNKAEIKRIITNQYKYNRFDDLPNSIMAFTGTCKQCDIIDEHEYEKKKKQKKWEKLLEKEKEIPKPEDVENRIAKKLKEEYSWSWEELGNLFGKTENAIRMRVTRWNKRTENIKLENI